MSLTKYKQKRNFKESPEPVGGKSVENKLCFVIQKHDASRLHYDLRLELAGVLKSWAVPKGPSTNSAVKRLAIMVEDHPIDYKTFEGVIPGGYGAGTVIVWDEGFYELANSESKNKKMQEKELIKGISSGKLHIIFYGKKLKGEYALVKTHGKAENAWLFFKIKDSYSSKKDITLRDKSVLSNRTISQMEKVYNANNRSIKISDNSISKGPKNKKSNDDVIKEGRLSKFPSKLSPMLCTLVDQPFDSEGWQYEIKWDGYRAIAFCNKNKVELRSRNDKYFNKIFYPIYTAIQEWNISAVVDGEIVVMDKNGKSNFGVLQNWKTEADGDLFYFVFDLLWMNGCDLMNVPLYKRRKLLKNIILNNDTIKFSENYDASGIEFFESIKKLGLEGMIAKKSDSIYSPGYRSKEWLKIKVNNRQEMVIGGYLKSEDSTKPFKSLLLGVYEKEKLIYTGKVGTGFSIQLQKELLKQFKPYISKSNPFSEQPPLNKPSRFHPIPSTAEVIWMKPKLICEVSFAEMTSDGLMRHPTFEGMRIDKKSKDIMKEKTHSKRSSLKNTRTKKNKSFLNPTEESQTHKINGRELNFTNLNKLYWPKEKIMKRDMLNYYHEVAPYILPYLKDRPQAMNRHPNGITGESFYFKDVTGTAPKWIETFKYKSDSDNRIKNYLVAKDEASLLYMANLGCIEMNPWHSKVKTKDFPDWCIIDLDPGEKTFNQVIEAAIITRDVLISMDIISYPKTSGSSGIHIYIPLGAKYTYEQSKEFAHVIATLVHNEIPKFTSLERIVKARKGKMYIDFLQNRPQATVAAPYSLRPKQGATVSMPLHWTEIKKGLKTSDFTIHNAIKRIQEEGDIFKSVLGKGINMKKIVKQYND